MYQQQQNSTYDIDMRLKHTVVDISANTIRRSVFKVGAGPFIQDRLHLHLCKVLQAPWEHHHMRWVLAAIIYVTLDAPFLWWRITVFSQLVAAEF